MKTLSAKDYGQMLHNMQEVLSLLMAVISLKATPVSFALKIFAPSAILMDHAMIVKSYTVGGVYQPKLVRTENALVIFCIVEVAWTCWAS